MRAHVPVVISKQSGVSEVLTHAIKVDFWDIDATADAIYGLLHYPALSKLFAEEGAAEVDNLKWEYVAKKLVKIYEKTLHYE
jgi:glycosyltransferase involved in cell wall biosynthesis